MLLFPIATADSTSRTHSFVMSSMEFWSVKVKPGEIIKCDPGVHTYIHLSQAALGKRKKKTKTENVLIFARFNDKKIVLGTLSTYKCAQIAYCIEFQKEFQLFHSSKNVNVYFCGYKFTLGGDDSMDHPEFDPDFSKAIPLNPDTTGDKSDGIDKYASSQEDGTIPRKAETRKKRLAESASKTLAREKSAKLTTPVSSQGTGDKSDDKDKLESSQQDETIPTEAETGKKRLAESASKSLEREKKAKLTIPVTNKKTGRDDKKGNNAAKVHPLKESSKPAGSVSCKSCSKAFNSENALQEHTKAKHDTAESVD